MAYLWNKCDFLFKINFFFFLNPIFLTFYNFYSTSSLLYNIFILDSEQTNKPSTFLSCRIAPRISVISILENELKKKTSNSIEEIVKLSLRTFERIETIQTAAKNVWDVNHQRLSINFYCLFEFYYYSSASENFKKLTSEKIIMPNVIYWLKM